MEVRHVEHEVKIVKLLTPYLMAFPQSKMNEGGLVVYAKALRTLSLVQIDAAMTKLLRTMIFFPSVAEIFEQVEVLTKVASGIADKSPDEAWLEVVRQMQEAFVYKKPIFSTPEIEKAALSMGWMSLCEMPSEGANTARAQFLKMYDVVLKRKRENKINGDVLAMLSPEKLQSLVGNTGTKLSLVSNK